MSSIRPPSKKLISLLLASPDNQDQVLITKKLQTKGFRTKLIITPTAEETLAYLRESCLATLNFPRLLLLDAALLRDDPAWSLLITIQSDYPGLPVVLLSPDCPPEAVIAAYQRGIQAVIIRSDDRRGRLRQVDALLDYWLGTVALPRLIL